MAQIKSAGSFETVRMANGDYLRKWEVVVDDNGQETPAEMWTQDKDDASPRVGENVNLENGKNGLKAKRPKRQQSGGSNSGGRSGGGGGGGKGSWVPRLEDDPVVYAAKQAAIAAQTSLERAIDSVARLDAGPKTNLTDEKVDFIIALADRYANYVQGRAKAAGQRVKQSQAGKAEGS